MPTPHTTHARRITAIISALASTALILALFSTAASAGQWIQVSCVNPNQSAAPSQGWTSFTTGAPGYGSNNSTGCGPGAPMSAILSTDAAAEVYSGENLEYAPPKGSELDGGQVDVSMDADGGGYDASGTAIAYSPEFVYSGSDVLFQCARGQTLCANGTNDYSGVLTLPSNKGGDFYIGAGCGGAKGAICNEGGSNGAWSLVQVWWANFLLTNNTTLAATSIGGTLLDPNARGTQELAFIASDPEGPGVYDVTAQIDGQTIYTGTPNSNAGQCSPVGESNAVLMFDSSQPCPASESVDLPVNTTSVPDGQHTLKLTVEDAAGNTSVVYDGTITTHNAPQNTTATSITTPASLTVASTLTAHPGTWTAPTGAGAITYTYQWEDCNTEANNCQPIPGAQNTTYTPTSTDAGHTIRLTVTAQNNDGASTATNTTSTITATPESPLSPLLEQQAGGTNTSPLVAGTPNGTPASETAILHLNNPTPTTRTFGRKAFKLTGYFAGQTLKLTGLLTNNQSQPIANATLDVLQQAAGTSTLTLIRHTSTSTTGTFTITLPPGPSRLIEIAYRALSSDTKYSATAEFHETVHATAQLRIGIRETTPNGTTVISSHHTTPTGTIVISGKIDGPISPQGTIVELLVHYLGYWEPIRDPRTNSTGHFHIEYQFKGSIGNFPFLVEILAGQTNYPYTTGYSNTINITTR
jgi:hypothetical protein